MVAVQKVGRNKFIRIDTSAQVSLTQSSLNKAAQYSVGAIFNGELMPQSKSSTSSRLVAQRLKRRRIR